MATQPTHRWAYSGPVASARSQLKEERAGAFRATEVTKVSGLNRSWSGSLLASQVLVGFGDTAQACLVRYRHASRVIMAGGGFAERVSANISQLARMKTSNKKATIRVDERGNACGQGEAAVVESGTWRRRRGSW